SHTLRSGGDRGGQGQDRRGVAVVGEVMFREPDRVEAEGLGMFDEVELVAVDVGEWPAPCGGITKAEHHTNVQTGAEHRVPPVAIEAVDESLRRSVGSPNAGWTATLTIFDFPQVRAAWSVE